MSAKPVVCVTGSSGYVASRVIHHLRETGKYTVRATVRNPSDEKKTEFLRRYGDVEIVAGDLLKEGSFDEAFAGAQFVIHTASPFIISTEDPENDLYKPAIEGTKNVLNSCLKNKVKRVVLTSSMAAVCGSQRDRDAKHVWVEEDWNGDALTRQSKSPYVISKTLAELAAWEFIGKHPEIELVVINPCFVLGPPIYERCEGTSLERAKALLEGAMKPVLPGTLAIVDVRTVAEAHVKGLEVKKANQRFLLCNSAQSSYLELSQVAKKHFPQYPVCTELAEGVATPQPNPNSTDNSRAREVLGVRFYSVEETMKDMFEAMISLGAIKKIE